MNVEVLSIHPNASTWIIAGLKRRTSNLINLSTQHTLDGLCNEVADELGFEYERKDNGNLYFKDKQ